MIEPRFALRRLTQGFLIAGVVACASPAIPAQAQVVTDPVVQEEIKLARDTLINAASGRGASGSIMEFVKNSDNLICQSWIIAFNLRLRNLVLEGADPEVIAKAYDLRWKVEKACQSILEEKPPAGVSVGGPDPAPQPTAGSPFVPRDGWTITDEICYRKCTNERGAYERAIYQTASAERRQRDARADAERARANLAQAQRQVDTAKAELAGAEAGLNTPRSGSLTAAQERELVSLGNRRTTAQNALRLGQPQLAAAEAAAAKAEATLRTRDAEAAEAHKALDDARLAYEDCMRRCKTAADHANAPSGTTSCATTPSSPVVVGAQKEVGAGLAHVAEDTARGLVGNPLGRLGGGIAMGVGGRRDSGPPGRRAANDGPRLAADPVPLKQAFVHPQSQARILVGGRITDQGLSISTEIAEAPSKGTFQSVYLENDDCQQLRPQSYVLWKLWEEWTLTVRWTYDRFVDGQHVSHEEGGWKESGRRDLASGVDPSDQVDQNPIWKRFGFDRATEGIKGLGTTFAASRETLTTKSTKLVIHVSNPGRDPVSTIPIDLRVTPNADGTLSFTQF